MPIASMFFFHSSSPCARARVRRRPALDRERLAVGRLAVAVAVAVLVAEAIEQRARERRVVELRLRLEGRVVARDIGRDRPVRGRRAALQQHADRLGVVVAHADRAAQRDLLQRVAADDRIFHVEVDPPRIRPQQHVVHDAPRGERRQQVAVRVERLLGELDGQDVEEIDLADSGTRASAPGLPR